MPRAIPRTHSGATFAPVSSRLSSSERENSGHRRYKRRSEGRRGDLAHRPSRSNQYRREDRAAADPIDAADNPDDQREPDDPGLGKRRAGGGRRGEQEPDAERKQNRADHDEERIRAREQLDADDPADDDARERAKDQKLRERGRQGALAPKAEQSARGCDDVVEKVRRRHRRIRDVEDADLDRDQEDGARDAGGRCRRRDDERERRPE